MEFSKKSERQSKQQKTSGNKGSGFSLEDNRKEVAQRKPNNTGLPNNLKSSIENMSGHSMDDVKVHYNSSKPAQYQAHAYAQGSQIHLASGQERHLPHEAWHVVQQKQGRVKPTMQMNGGAVNDDPSLEKEADVMGGKAMQKKSIQIENKKLITSKNALLPIQPKWSDLNKWSTNAKFAGFDKSKIKITYGDDFIKNHLRKNTDASEEDMKAFISRYGGRKASFAGKNTMLLKSDIETGMAALNYTDPKEITGDRGSGFYAYISLANKAFDWRPLNANNAVTEGNMRLSHKLDFDKAEVWGYVSANIGDDGKLSSVEFKVTHLAKAFN